MRKRPELRGRVSDYRNHSKNSLRSDSFSCRFACLAYAIQESKMIPIIVHPINTSSCGMFWELLSFSQITAQCVSFLISFENILRQAKRAELVTALRASCFLVINHSKTFRTRRSLEECKSFESLLSLWLRWAIWVTKCEMLFERSEFIERFEGFIVPASELRTFSHSFFCFGFLSGDRKKMKSPP